MAGQLQTNTEALESLIAAIEAMPKAIVIDTTLAQAGKAADAKATGDAIANHNQTANTITAGTFAGAVVSQTSSQDPATSLLRNSKIVKTATNPSYNGEICWTYE